MSRPQYETEQNLSEEHELKTKAQLTWGMEFLKLPTHWLLDFIIRNRNGQCVGFAEIKCRKILTCEFPTFIISKRKFERGVSLSQKLGFLPVLDGRNAQSSPVLRSKTYKHIPFLIMVRCLDKDIYYKYDSSHVEKGELYLEKSGGRTKDARDAYDIEEVIHIPWRLFKDWPEIPEKTE